MIHPTFGSATSDVPGYDPRRAELQDHPVSLAMQSLVPLAIMELSYRGGPTDADFDRARELASDMVEPGSELLTGCSNVPEAKGKNLLGKMAYCMAVLAHCPGGVPFAGIRYKAGPGNQVKAEPVIAYADMTRDQRRLADRRARERQKIKTRF